MSREISGAHSSAKAKGDNGADGFEPKRILVIGGTQFIGRLLVNAAYWAVGLEKKITNKTNAELVGEYQPTMYGFNGAKKGVKPADHELK